LATNATSFLSTGLLSGATYYYRVSASNAAGNSTYSGPVSATTPILDGARINFQPASAPVPPGYLPDTGQVYAEQTNGFTYGWSSSRSSSAVDRNATNSPDQRYDTYISTGTSTSTRWELAVPNGIYNVWLVAGDPTSTSGTYRYSVE